MKWVCIVLCSACACSLAHAHIMLSYPPARTPNAPGAPHYMSPCGDSPDPGPAKTRTVLSSGTTISVQWTETIDHPSHYRISFDADGQDAFTVPLAYDDFYNGPAVLLDDIADPDPGAPKSVDVTLPNVACDECTLQLIQVRYDAPPYTIGPDSSDVHYQCADVVLISDRIFVSGFE